jgi:light-regulated signal transduction histidine kinase (bacteriophytochrome)
VRPYMEQALRGELANYERELPYQGGGPRWVQVTYTPHAEGDQVLGFFVHVVDIGERVQAEKELNQFAEQLQRSNKELEEFAYMVSHDLKEPLRKVERFGEQIQKRAGSRLNEGEQDYLERMINASVRMRKIIDDLLALSRVISAGQPFEEVDLNQVVEGVLDDLEDIILQKNAHIQVESLPVIKADATQMQLLFQNLLGNALKFNSPGRPPQIKVGYERTDPGMVKIWVEDDGIGFDMKFVQRLFVPFSRLHGRSEYEGSGIGLAICRRIVERHFGSISAVSQPGQGTRFTFTLPI